MINLFVFNLKQFREGIISTNNKEDRQNITLKLSFRESDGSPYEYIFIKDTYSEKYLDIICYLLDRIYSAIEEGSSAFKLDFDKKNSSIYASGFIFDKVIITIMGKESYTEMFTIQDINCHNNQ